MSRILALAKELNTIKRKSAGKRSRGISYARSVKVSRAFDGLPYDFNEAYAAIHQADQMAHQQSLEQGWSRSLEGELVFQQLVTTNTAQFLQRVREISTQLQINPNWLMAVMHFESRLNHQAVNRISGATGLIQFMPSTAQRLGTTTQALAQMTNVQQLEYVLRYYNHYRGRMRNYLDCYLVTFYPYAIGRPETFVLGSERSPERAALIARQNPGMDTNRDGQVTLAEVRQRIYQRLTTEQAALINAPYTP
ncbi:MAG: transglycosylase SLT domain-containing protein [Bacteroidota bacterium]